MRPPPSRIFRRLRKRNPAPYGFFINLGEQEYLVGASPEMFVRCESIAENDYRPGAIRVETCPISGTVARGADAARKRDPQGSPEVGAQDGTGERKQLGHRGLSMRRTTT